VRRFAELFDALDATRSRNEQVRLIAEHVSHVPPEDAVWAMALLRGDRGRRAVSTTKLRAWAAQEAGIPEWLVEASYASVGDLGETLSLLLGTPSEASDDLPLSLWLTDVIPSIAQAPEEEQRERVVAIWRRLHGTERMLFNKLLGGSFRVGVSRGIVDRAIGEASGLGANEISLRLAGGYPTTGAFFTSLLRGHADGEPQSRPYPFMLAQSAPSPMESLGEVSEYLLEWKWDGIRAQLIRRNGQVSLWSRGEESVTEWFPEIRDWALRHLEDGTVLDGEVVAGTMPAPRSFHQLQRRLQRRVVPPRLMAEVPVSFIAYDLLEHGHSDLRSRPLRERAQLLETLSRSCGSLTLSKALSLPSWSEVEAARQHARHHGAEGVMIKHGLRSYGSGRMAGNWYKAKSQPWTVDAVLVYAQPGHGRRANLYTDYTFALRADDSSLQTVAKAYSGLTDAEILEVDRWIKANTIERFGPVRSVRPERVFEIAFEGIAPSGRHKSGVAVRFPRIVRLRPDKTAADCDTVEHLRSLASLDEPGRKPSSP
jgi:DNA ligase-1